MDNEKILAKAILELAEKCARVWIYDGEQITTEGVFLDDEKAIKEIAEDG